MLSSIEVQTGTTTWLEIADMAAENGITYSPVYRREKTVTSMNGTEYKSQVVKRNISVTFMDLDETTYLLLLGAFTELSGNTYVVKPLVTIKENVSQQGFRKAMASPGHSEKLEGTFYVSDFGHDILKVLSGNSYYSGLSLTLEEK